MKTYVGIDIGGTAVKIGLIQEEGQVLFHKEYEANTQSQNVSLLKVTIQGAMDFKELCERQGFQVFGTGVSATGQINGKSGVVIGTGGNIQGWLHTNLKEELAKVFHGELAVENDVNCAAIAEHWIGAGKGFSDLFIYTVGTGIGGALILHDRLYSGAKGIAGEFGHFSIDHQGTLCSCGNRGCFERYGSVTALLEQVKDLPGWKIESGREFFQLLETERGKRELQPILDRFIHYHSSAVVSILHLLNPQAIIIGGGISSQHKHLIEPIREKVRSCAMPNFSDEIQIIPARLGNQAGMIGAVRNLLDSIIS